jgi:AcrR family transcriptional regulator
MNEQTKTRTSPQLGLRERKKLRTRQTIVEVALRLFAEQGYAETTLSEIADAAEVSTSTFFNYFPAKDAIVFELADQLAASACTRVAERPEDEPTAHAIVSWIREDLAEIEQPYAEVLRLIPGIVASDPALIEGQKLRLSRVEDAFAEGFARELGEPSHGMRSRVLSVIALQGIIDVWDVWYRHHFADPDFDLGELLALKAEYVGRALEAGLDTVAALPEPPDT